MQSLAAWPSDRNCSSLIATYFTSLGKALFFTETQAIKGLILSCLRRRVIAINDEGESEPLEGDKPIKAKNPFGKWPQFCRHHLQLENSKIVNCNKMAADVSKSPVIVEIYM